MNRRAFLFGVSGLAITAASPALTKPEPLMAARSRAISAGTAPAFFGNPNVTITSVNTTGGIVTSRDADAGSFQTPFFIQVSASAITAIGTSAPYEDLSYAWDFGDPTGTETLVRPTDSATVNANVDQHSPEAAYCYRRPGTYTITLTVIGKNGTGYTTASVSKQVIVRAFSPTSSLWVDQVNGNDSNLGTSSSSPKKSVAAINAGIGSNKVVHLARGSRWSGSTGINFTAAAVNGCRIDAYGSGPNPLIEISAGAQIAPLIITNGGSSSPTAQTDIVISNVDFLQSGSANAGTLLITAGGNNTAKLRNIYLDNCNASMTMDSNSFAVAVANVGANPDMGLTSNFGFWKTTFTNPTTTKTISMGLLGSAVNWSFVVGGAFAGASTSNIFDHHIYPDTRYHSYYAWIDFGATGTGEFQRSFCINGNWDGPYMATGVNQLTQYHCISENMMANTLFAFDLGNRSNNTHPSDSTVQFQYVVAQGNAMKNLGGTSAILFACGLSVTMRDNRVWQSSGGYWFSPAIGQLASVSQKTNLISRIYRNKVYFPSTSPAGATFFYQDQGWTQPQQITDNIIYDSRPAGQFVRLASSDQNAAGSIIDRNIYYAPNTSGWPTNAASWMDNATPKTLTQWKALRLDINASQANPGWTTPVTRWSDMK